MSNVAAWTGRSGASSAESHSRTPIVASATVAPACTCASARVAGLLMPNACVGAPTTSSSSSGGSRSGAAPTSRSATSGIRLNIPSHTACAT